MKVVVSRAAQRDLMGIGDYIAQGSPGRAEPFVMDLVAAARAIGDTPFAWPVMARYEAVGLRRKLHGRYLILYVVQPERVEIVRVIHGARDLGRIGIDPSPE
jgi:toxin ParE1/3/4